ncbi:cyclic lactone autoinducer peptide [Paenibacillus sp. DMB5]|nr:cyclic lactone autoinducer peptide [Paenibacillus sp. DMB5]
MKKTIARYASKTLASSARLFSTVLKPFAHSPEAPQELRK